MKRVLLLSALTLLSCACGATPMPGMATQLGCETCHSIDHPGSGPSWMAVSLRYRPERNDPAVFKQLVTKISRGGAGNWGGTPMVAADPIGKHQDKIKQIVRFILSLSDRAPADRAPATQQAALDNSR